MAITPHDGSGTDFTFQSTNFTVTSIAFSESGGQDNLIDVSHLGQTTGESVLTMGRPLIGSAGGEGGKTVNIEFLGKNKIAGNSSGTLVINHNGVDFVNVTNATCVSCAVTFTLNDAIKGTAQFRLP
jgi:hypothetical protein